MTKRQISVLWPLKSIKPSSPSTNIPTYEIKSVSRVSRLVATKARDCLLFIRWPTESAQDSRVIAFARRSQRGSETRIPLSMRVSCKPCLEVNDPLEITANLAFLFVVVSKLSSTIPRSILSRVIRLDKDDCVASVSKLSSTIPCSTLSTRNSIKIAWRAFIQLLEHRGESKLFLRQRAGLSILLS